MHPTSALRNMNWKVKAGNEIVQRKVSKSVACKWEKLGQALPDFGYFPQAQQVLRNTTMAMQQLLGWRTAHERKTDENTEAWGSLVQSWRGTPSLFPSAKNLE